MKSSLFLVLTILLIACQKDDIGSSSLLYQRWQSVTDGSYVTFQSNGIILYGKDGSQNPCCLPRFFTRENNTLIFTGAPAKPLPANIVFTNCALVKCAGSPAWHIVELTSQRLMIDTGLVVATYQAVP
jgi:hypothetical protein